MKAYQNRSVSTHNGISPSPVYSSPSLKSPAPEHPEDGHIAYVRDRFGRAALVMWDAIFESYVDPIIRLRSVHAA